MKRSAAAFWMVWCIAFGAWATKNFAQHHEPLDLAFAFCELVLASYYAGRLWGKR